tara:strand:+ start:101 stop:475 length:375 start_codon:yes stop_codon:yes gene_type:complete
MNNKLLSISDLAKKLNLISRKSGKLSVHTLRFWETKFKQIKPIKLSGNRRYYSDKQVKKISLIKFLLKDKKISIDGVKAILNNDINNLDDFHSSSIKAEYIKIKSINLLKKLKNLKNYGKKNTR